MASSLHQRLQLGELARDLDMVVFKLELPAPEGVAEAQQERRELRRELERMRDEMEDLVRALEG
jgi:SMC interacting uncharacterized protein involved in chromosome segregation